MSGYCLAAFDRQGEPLMLQDFEASRPEAFRDEEAKFLRFTAATAGVAKAWLGRISR